MTTLVHVNRNIIASNARHGRDDPPIRIQRDQGEVEYCHEVEILGPSRLVYSAHKPILSCGARLVLTTEGDVKVSR